MVVQLVDVHATRVPTDPEAPERALQAVLSHFRRLQRPVLHTLGNHCLYSFTRQQLNSRLGVSLKGGKEGSEAGLLHWRCLQRQIEGLAGRASPIFHARDMAAAAAAAATATAGIDGYNASLPHSYYTFRPPVHRGWRLLVLDGYELSVLGWSKDHFLYQQAAKVLAERNPNQVGPAQAVWAEG